MTDPRRFFSGREHTALFVLAGGRCEACHAELEPGWHADHRIPHSKQGPTDVTNGQALCAACNLQKGSRHVELRQWQQDALDDFLGRNSDFLCVATPGAGKTTFSLAAATRLIERGEIEKIIVVTPTAHLRRQWASVAHSVFGVQLDHEFKNGTGAVAQDYDGVAVTYQSIATSAFLYRAMVSRYKTLVILDEIHHGGERAAWGVALREAFEGATRRLLLSGTPFRSDGTPIPFVQYRDGQCVSDYSYDYGAALADRDGVVRQISFPAFDGEGRWQEAGIIEQRLSLVEDERARSKAINSVLLPNGQWITDVLTAANTELSQQRETMPDAAGLVIASDQLSASAYAKRLQSICGESVTLVTSDVPDSSEQIHQFTNATSRWIVAVQMVSEGVDIPRLVVGVYATNVGTELFFRQVAGRLVRTRGIEDESCATLFIPSLPDLLGYASTIERMVPKALQELEEKARTERKDDDGSVRLDIVQSLDPSEAVHLATIFSGQAVQDAELKQAMEWMRALGIPANVKPEQIALLLRAATKSRTLQTVTVTPEIPQRSLIDEKKAVRKALQHKVRIFARLSGAEHVAISADLNRFAGDGKKVPTADLAGLKARLELVDRWIDDSR